MKLIKTILALLLISLIFVVPFFSVSADTNDSIYAGIEDQEYIFSCLKKESSAALFLQQNGIILIKETITPIYTLSLSEFAEDDTIEIKPFLGPADFQNQQVYIAKTVTENNEFAGNIKLCVKDGEAHILSFNPSDAIKDRSDSTPYHASCSYADHASRIAAMLKSDELLHPENVRFVSIHGYEMRLGECFYIIKGSKEFFIPVGYINVDSPETDIVITREELKEYALKDTAAYNEYINKLEEWKKDHPDTNWIPVGSGSTGSELKSGCSSVENIIDINSWHDRHFGIRKEDINETNKNNDHDSTAFVTGTVTAVSIIVIIGTAATVIVLIFKNRRRATDNT